MYGSDVGEGTAYRDRAGLSRRAHPAGDVYAVSVGPYRLISARRSGHALEESIAKLRGQGFAAADHALQRPAAIEIGALEQDAEQRRHEMDVA